MRNWYYLLCAAVWSLSQTAIAHTNTMPEFGCCPQPLYEPVYQQTYCEPAACNPCCNTLTSHHLLISAEGLLGKGIGHNDENCALELFYSPESGDTWQPFIDIKGHHLPSGNWAANAGIGIRCLASSLFGDCCDRTFGANVFYDYRRFKRTAFSQIGIGLESLGEKFDFRINGYFPLHKKARSFGAFFDDYIGGYIVIANTFWIPMTGVDGEVGMSLFE